MNGIYDFLLLLTMYVIYIVFKLLPLEDAHIVIWPWKFNQGQIQGHQSESDIWLTGSV